MLANFDATIDQFTEFEAFIARLLEAWRTGDLKAVGKNILTPLCDTSPSVSGGCKGMFLDHMPPLYDLGTGSGRSQAMVILMDDAMAAKTDCPSCFDAVGTFVT